jgi:hypothetical protein
VVPASGRFRALLVAALAVSVLSGSEGAAAQALPDSLVLGNAVIAPAIDPGGVVVSLVLRNESARPITVTSVVPVADDELDVDVLGITGCRAGCAGAMGWQDAQPLLTRLAASPEGVVVPPESAVAARRADGLWVVLRISPRDTEAEASLQHRCLFVEELRVRVDGGRSQPLRNRLEDFVAAVDRPDAGQPGVTRNCALF